MDLGLTGKVAVITGGSRGLGLAAAKALIAEGAHVVICARGEEQLQTSAKEIQAQAASGARVSSVAADVSSDAGVTRVVDAAVKEFGRLDVVVNNVGLGKGADLEGTTDADWQEALDQTLFPAIRMSRAAVPHLRKQHGGAIVIVSSIFGREAGGRMTYNAVKAAEISLAKSLGPATGEGSDSRGVDCARVDPVRRRLVVEAAASRSGRYQAVRQAGTAFWSLWQAGGSGRRHRVSRVTEGELDQRDDRRC